MDSPSWLLLFAINFVLRPASCVPQQPLASTTGAAEFLQSAAPELSGGNRSAPSCGGCYLVADVAGLVWYSEVFINTAATALVSVGIGNGTSATIRRTSISQDVGDFTFNPTDTASAGGALTQLNFEPTVYVAGARLTSPTAYNVFTAYSVTSAFTSNGVCVTTSGSAITLTSAYSEVLPSADGQVTIDTDGQQGFINFLGFTTCSGGGENFVPTALLQIMNTTATTTSTFTNVPLAAAVASLTIAPQSVPASASPGAITGGPSTTVFPSAGVPNIVVGNRTITPTANPIALSVYNGTMTTTTPTSQTTGSSVAALPTGDNVSSYVAFLGAGPTTKADGWLAVWGAGMLVSGALVYCL